MHGVVGTLEQIDGARQHSLRQIVKHQQHNPLAAVVAQRSRRQRPDGNSEVGRDKPGAISFHVRSDLARVTRGAERTEKIDHVPPLSLSESALELRHPALGPSMRYQPEELSCGSPRRQAGA